MLAHNPIANGAARHINTRDFSSATSGEVSITGVDSNDNIVDLFTKPLPRAAFRNLSCRIGMRV